MKIPFDLTAFDSQNFNSTQSFFDAFHFWFRYFDIAKFDFFKFMAETLNITITMKIIKEMMHTNFADWLTKTIYTFVVVYTNAFITAVDIHSWVILLETIASNPCQVFTGSTEGN